MNKQIIVAQARQLLKDKFPTVLPQASCLYSSICLSTILAQNNVKCLIQAGSLSWEIVTPEQDDGISPTHFGYVWELNSQETRYFLENDCLPEMHVWSVIPNTKEIIDLTTGLLPEQCKKFIGAEWKHPIKPPDFLWCKITEIPSQAMYKPDIEAINVVAGLIKKVFGQ